MYDSFTSAKTRASNWAPTQHFSSALPSHKGKKVREI